MRLHFAFVTQGVPRVRTSVKLHINSSAVVGEEVVLDVGITESLNCQGGGVVPNACDEGPCGANADCSVSGVVVICNCR